MTVRTRHIVGRPDLDGSVQGSAHRVVDLTRGDASVHKDACDCPGRGGVVLKQRGQQHQGTHCRRVLTDHLVVAEERSSEE